jgi:hypothetical protein
MSIAQSWAFVGAVMLLACSGTAERPAPFDGPGEPSESAVEHVAMPDEAEPAAPKPGDTKLCTEGASRSCKVMLPKHGSIQNCYVGVQLCVGDSWSECGDEEALFYKYFGES